MHVRKDDTVEVIAGDDRGTQGKVLQVDHAAGKVVVEGVARVFKHVRRSQRNPQGGRLSKEMPIQLSNVMLVCGSCNAAVRTGVRTLDDAHTRDSMLSLAPMGLRPRLFLCRAFGAVRLPSQHRGAPASPKEGLSLTGVESTPRAESLRVEAPP